MSRLMLGSAVNSRRSSLSPEEVEYHRQQAILAERSTAPQNFTLRAIIVGLGFGVVVCFSNTYFGLQTGWVSTMSMPAALVGFAVLRCMNQLVRTSMKFTPVENVLIQTVAAAIGTMPFGCGFVGIVPALEYLLTKDEGAPVRLGPTMLIIWSLGLCYFGVFFAVPLRKQVIIREKLKFPSGTAAAHMIAILHGDEQKGDSSAESGYSSISAAADASGSREDDDYSAVSEERSSSWRKKIQILLLSFTFSSVYTVLSYFFPILRKVPIFGAGLASNWLWSLNPSPAYVGQGMIMGPEVTLHMLAGAVVGWGILSPIAKINGWAPGEVDDWNAGSKGWIVWVSLAIMLTDSVTNLGWMTIRQVLVVIAPVIGAEPDPASSWKRLGERCGESLSRIFRPSRQSWSGYLPLQPADNSDERGETEPLTPGLQIGTPQSGRPAQRVLPEPDTPPETLVPIRVISIGLAASLLLCIAAMHFIFPFLPAPLTVLSLGITLILSVMAVRAMGETDINPASGISKLSQLLVSFFTVGSPHAIIINLVAGAISESGALQSGELMQDLKTGHILGASPRAQFYGQLIGVSVGSFVATATYRLYTSVYTIPGGLFEIPTAYVWIFTARLVTGGGLPPAVAPVAALFGLVFTATTVVRIATTARWRRFVPGGIAFAIGMYNVPSFTLARAAGGVVKWYWDRPSRLERGPVEGAAIEETDATTPLNRSSSSSSSSAAASSPATAVDPASVLVVVASGLILGEGMFSILNLVLAGANVSHF